jgi:endonuclease/exonuclease/phosphatase family metal-dependent hydrolase
MPDATRRARKRGLQAVLWLAGACMAVYVLYWVLVGILAIAHQYQPTESTLAIEGSCNAKKWPDKLQVLTWNVGYAGTGAEEDFFLDGGQDVLAKDRASVVRHLGNITAVLGQIPADVYLVEEVDSGSRRTYGVDERQTIIASLSACCSSYALNHDAFFIPHPKLKPLGRVRSGMLALGKFRPGEAKRYQLRGRFPWPYRAFEMERCLQAWRLPRGNGTNWTIIQLHLEAWDGGNIRGAELAQLRGLALREYSQGNSVILGGDWNAVLPGVRLNEFTERKPGARTLQLNADFLPPGWTWGIDHSRPTNRSVEGPYDPQKNYLTIIDGFVVSPNVQIDAVKTLPLNFQDSDHEPVSLEVESR